MLPSVSSVERLLHSTFLFFNAIAANVNEMDIVIGRPEVNGEHLDEQYLQVLKRH